MILEGYKLFNSIDVNLEGVDGWGSLTDAGKELFQEIYFEHMKRCNELQKLKWIPFRVTEHETHLKVYMVNDDWFHYYKNGTWG